MSWPVLDNQTPHLGRLIHEHHYVQWIAVAALECSK